MEWKRILKAPLPLDARDKRNENYKQAIIAYEKNNIEPKLDEFIRQRPALENKIIYIGFTDNESGHEVVQLAESKFGAIVFTIHMESVPELGMNRQFIVDTIGKLYSDEGYEVNTTGNDVNSYPCVQIKPQ